jgi:hypothetical protein
LRLVGDPEADAVVQEVYPKGHEAIASLNKALGRIVRNDDPVAEDLPPPVRSFLEAGALVGRAAGGWDEARLQEGAEFFEDYGLYIPLLLQLVTMPILYAARKGVQVLAFTERLEKYAHRRSIETGQLTFDVLARDGFLPKGKGRRSSQKVRLMHAAVRHFVQSSGRWNEQEFGVPINQEDLLGTLGAFSVAIVDALRKVGADFTDREAEDFYYRWRAVGQLIGIDPRFIAYDLSGAREDFALIQRRQNASCPESRRLIQSWIFTLEEMLPGKRFDSLIGPAIRHLVGPEISAILGVDVENTLEGAFAKKAEFAQKVDRLVGRETVMRAGLNMLAYAVIQSLYVNDRGLKRHSFSLPTSVANRWHIRITSDGLAVPTDTGGSDDGSCTTVFNDFAASLAEPDRATLHASLAMLIGMVVRADGTFDLLERAAVSKVMDYQVPKHLGDDFRWSYVARREYQALCEGGARYDARPFDGRLVELGRILDRMPADLRTTYRSFVARTVLRVAETSGTVLWFGMKVGREEKAVLGKIATSLGLEVPPEVAAKLVSQRPSP